MLRRAFCLLTLSLWICAPVFAQTTTPVPATPTKDSTAVNLISSALSAMDGAATVNDVTLTATITRTVGKDSDSGSATLEAIAGANAASVNYQLPGKARAVVVNATSQTPGAWSGADGTWHAVALHNTWAPAAWFAPAVVLGNALNDPTISLANLGATTWNGQAAEHIQFFRVLPAHSGAPSTLALIQALSTVDVYLNPATNLPLGFDFNLHPDSNAGVNIPIEIRFSNWQNTSGGVLAPFHIEKFFNGSLLDDISVSSARLNSGLTSASFTVPNTGGAQ